MKLNPEEMRVFLKLAEELSELSVEILQSINKEDKNNWKKINNEISDVEKWIHQLKQISNVKDGAV